jgi:hypothetical protein
VSGTSTLREGIYIKIKTEGMGGLGRGLRLFKNVRERSRRWNSWVENKNK